MAKKLEDYEWICPDAFVGLTTNPDGSISPCCEHELYNEDGWEMANVKTDSFDDYNNSSLIKKLRHAFKTNDKKFLNKSCKKCIKAEKYGLTSTRKNSYKKYFDEYKHKKEELEKIIETEIRPTFLQSPMLVSLGQGQCNLKCGMCHDFTSSARRRESIELGEIDNTFPSTVNIHGRKFEKDFNWIIDNCLEFHLPHAEPLLVKKNYDIMKKLNKDKKIIVITNGTINVDKFIDCARDYKNVDIFISIEGGEKVNTYIRYPSKWEIIIENFDKLNEYKNFNVQFISTLNALNVGKFTQMKKDIGKRNYGFGKGIVFNDPWTISSIPDDIKKVYLNDLYEFGNTSIINYVENSVFDEKLMIELMKHCKRRDKHRGTYLPDVFPEWTKYYDSVRLL